MIRGYAVEDGRLRPLAAPLEAAERVAWFDLLRPDAEEEAAVERVLGIEVPTREDMEEIEESSRLYREEGAAYMTALLPAGSETGSVVQGPVTFILAGGRLVTVRYHEPKPFATFPVRAEKIALGCVDGVTVLLGLLDAVVDRLADILEVVGRDIEKASRGVFQDAGGPGTGPDYRAVLREIGRQGELVSQIHDSLITLERLIAFQGAVGGKETRTRGKTLARDTRFLTEHANFLAQKITFLLDATLGMISIEQNAIIKIFSVAAVIFLPPTLVASIYGMNFAVMPELGWLFGYPFALALMVLSAVLSYWIFKSRGWL
jgi:magnesium transporter